MLNCARGPLLKSSDNLFLNKIYCRTLKSWVGLVSYSILKDEIEQVHVDICSRILINCFRCDNYKEGSVLSQFWDVEIDAAIQASGDMGEQGLVQQ